MLLLQSPYNAHAVSVCLPLKIFMNLVYFKIFRSKDYTVPVNFVSAGLRKTAAEEKPPQQKGGSSDDSDGDGPSAPPPPRGTAPKKLQMVNIILCLSYSLHSIQ